MATNSATINPIDLIIGFMSTPRSGRQSSGNRKCNGDAMGERNVLRDAL